MNKPEPTLNPGIEINEDGIRIHIPIAPGLLQTTFLSGESMDDLCKKWQETRRTMKNPRALILPKHHD